jgi:hypothetical protein
VKEASVWGLRMRGRRGRTSSVLNGSSNQMPNKVTSGVLSRPSPCDVLQGYVSVAGLPAALLDDLVGHLVI